MNIRKDDSWLGAKLGYWQQTLEFVKEFVYLGSLMLSTNDVSLEIQQRTQTANKCFFGSICSRANFHAIQNSPFTRPWSAQSCCTAVRRGFWPKGRRTNCSYLRGRFSEQRYAAWKSKIVSTGEGTTTNSIKSLTAWRP
jgi:hypothetical protein